MKIQCQSCQAKYTIADEKVLGKVVKIRCKKCSATIVINGNETRPAEDNADTNVFDYAAQSNEQWTVNVADGDQRTLTPQEIVNEYRAGVVNDETYCWKDGMADWLPLREIEQLYGAVKLTPAAGARAPQRSIEEISLAPQSVPAPAPAAGALFGAADAAPAVDASPFAGGGHANGNGGALFGAETPSPAAAARRGGGRGQGQDLFGKAATAGGEDDVMTSAAAGGAAAAAATSTAEADSKLTGQRNENSVLFSLNALTSSAKEAPKGGPENKTTASGDGSGLIDIRALSATMGEDSDKKDKGARVDDIMNLSGGGAFGAALAAPILAPPPLEAVDTGYAGADAGGKSNNKMLFAILGGAAFIAIAIVVAVVIATKSSAPTAKTDPSATIGTGSAAPMGSLAMADTAGTASGAVTAPAATDNTPPPPGTGAATGKAGTQPPTGKAGALAHNDHPAAGGNTPSAPAAPAVPDPPKDTPPKDLNSALAQAAGKKDDGPKDNGGGGGATAPFDRGAATAAIGNVNVQSCKKADGPTGSGHVKITFAPNGSVSSAVVDSGPFPGTPVGGCVAGKFRGAHIPAFSGGAVTVGKSFTIN